MNVFFPRLPIFLAVMTAFSMAGGQLLFKLGAAQWRGETLMQWVRSFLGNPFLVSAIFLYAVTIIIWIYVLRVLPLSIAYPLTSLSYVIVPMVSWFLLDEKISTHTIIGTSLIIAGVIISNSHNG